MIELDHVSLRYGSGPPVLKDVSFNLAQGEIRFLTGASGSGKSSLLRMLFFAKRPSSGVAKVFGETVGGQDAAKRAHLRRRLGVVFQDFSLLDHLTVAENVGLPLRAAGQKAENYRRDVTDLLQWVGLKHRMDAYPDTLSGGEKQRVAIARAIVTKPDLILADEPTGSVDPAMAQRLLHLFLELNRLGTTILLATHDEQLIVQAKGRASHLEDGVLR